MDNTRAQNILNWSWKKDKFTDYSSTFTSLHVVSQEENSHFLCKSYVNVFVWGLSGFNGAKSRGEKKKWSRQNRLRGRALTGRCGWHHQGDLIQGLSTVNDNPNRMNSCFLKHIVHISSMPHICTTLKQSMKYANTYVHVLIVNTWFWIW